MHARSAQPRTCTQHTHTHTHTLASLREMLRRLCNNNDDIIAATSAAAARRRRLLPTAVTLQWLAVPAEVAARAQLGAAAAKPRRHSPGGWRGSDAALS